MNMAINMSQLAGWWDDIVDGILTPLKEMIITPIVIILYGLQMGFFYLIDCVQGVFRSMAGLSVYYYQGEAQEGDMVMSLLMDQTIVNVFWAVLIVAIMLLFITTIVAIIRSEFTEKNAKGPIISKSLKAIAYFAVVPVACLLGVWISNVFLRSFDQATSMQSSSLSATVFFAAAHDANRVRNGDDKLYDKIIHDSDMLKALNASASDDKDTLATKIDEAFLKEASTVKAEYSTSGLNYMYVMNGVSATKGLTKFTHYHMGLVYYFYDLFGHYNFLIGYVGGFTAAMLLLQSCLALIQRLYELALLFVISPAFIAFMPLDDGAKYKGWCGQFVKRVGMAYGPIIGLNLMFIILSRLQDVNIFNPSDPMGSMFNSIMQCVFMIVGLLAVKEFSSLISSLIGADDAAAKGSNMKNNVMEMGAKMSTGTIAAAKMGASVVGGAAKSITKRNDIKNARANEATAKTDSANADADFEEKKAAYEANPESADAKEAYEEAAIKKQNQNAAYESAKKATKKAEKGTFQGGLKNLRDGYSKAGFRGMAKTFEEDTGFGKSYAELAGAAGLGRWATFAGRDKAAEEGKSFLGNVPMFRDKDGNWMTRTEATKAEKKAKEGKDAQEGYDAQAKAFSDALDPDLARATIFRNQETGSAVTSDSAIETTSAGGGMAGFSHLSASVFDAELDAKNVAYRDRKAKELESAQSALEDLKSSPEMVGTAGRNADGTYVQQFRDKDGNITTQKLTEKEYNKNVKADEKRSHDIEKAEKEVAEKQRLYEDAEKSVRGGYLTEEEREQKKQNSADLDNFKALADLIAQAIANAQLKTKATFDPGQQVDIRTINGAIKIDPNAEIKLQQDYVEEIKTISTNIDKIWSKLSGTKK